MKRLNREFVRRLEKAIWIAPETPHGPGRERGMRLLRTLLVLGRDLAGGQLTLRAMSLVYTTLLSIVPLLALSFSVLKAFGVHNQIQPMLLRFLEPLGEKGVEVARRIGEFIQNMNVGVLGALGLALLLYTAISLMQKIEEALNFIWHIPRPRPLGERFSRYLSVLLIGPLLVFSAMGITATVMNMEMVQQLLAVDTLGQLIQVLTALMPYVLVIAAFSFIYLFIPNTRVRLAAALIGGAVGGIAWQTVGWIFALFVASSAQYAAIYSSFAILILFMIWLYLSWLVLLFGASVAFYVQQPGYLYASSGEPRLSNRMRERLALGAMALIAERFLAAQRGPTLAQFGQQLAVPSHALNIVLEALELKRLLVQSGDDPPVYLPARDLSLITLSEVMETVRAAGEERFFSPQAIPASAPVDDVIDRMNLASQASVKGMTVRDLVAQQAPADATRTPAP